MSAASRSRLGASTSDLAQEAEIEATLATLATLAAHVAHVAAHVDLDRLLDPAR